MKPLKRWLLLGTAALGLILTACGKPVADRVPGVDQMSYTITGKDAHGAKETMTVQLNADHTADILMVGKTPTIEYPGYSDGPNKYDAVKYTSGKIKGKGRHLTITATWSGQYARQLKAKKGKKRAIYLIGKYATKEDDATIELTFDKHYRLVKFNGEKQNKKEKVEGPSVSTMPSAKSQYLRLARKYQAVAGNSYQLSNSVGKSVTTFTDKRFYMYVKTPTTVLPAAWRKVARAGGELSPAVAAGTDQVMAEGTYHLNLLTGKLKWTPTRITPTYHNMVKQTYSGKHQVAEGEKRNGKFVTQQIQLDKADTTDFGRKLKAPVKLPTVAKWTAGLRKQAVDASAAALPPHKQAVPKSEWQNLFTGISPVVEQNASHRLRKKDAMYSKFKGEGTSYSWELSNDSQTDGGDKVVGVWKDNGNLLIELALDDEPETFKILLSDTDGDGFTTPITTYKLTYAGVTAKFGLSAGKYVGHGPVPTVFYNSQAFMYDRYQANN
ncbi:hypothetical protein [Lacticaseibacillus parakribbianus]|uniref:hypothetical protein n=1 Tax=Lacticaseibacillus parakribbianus TaxID=2970927 RepID=UPI0021CB7B19|nr:hypothetical protein [Lacticaseibacillus parakribbianus]